MVKITKSKLAIGICLASLVASIFCINVFAAVTSKIQGWDLVDLGKHLDWDGTSIYLSYFKSGVSTWESYKPGVIREDGASVIQDVKISDENVASAVAGKTLQGSNAIVFNEYQMKKLDDSQRQNVTTHELGHALGLDHNASSDLMYEGVTKKISLSENDKASYDAAYAKY